MTDVVQNNLFLLKLAVAGSAALCIFLKKKQSGKSFFPAAKPKSIFNGILLCCGVLSLFLWAGTLVLRTITIENGQIQISFDRYIHVHEMYHYYMGAKYFKENGYNGLYETAAIADLENGYGAEAEKRRIRDSRTKNLIFTQPILQYPERYKRRFSAQRWKDFKADVHYFRKLAFRNGPRQWALMNRDHGFNAPPVWCLLGSFLANLGDLNDRTLIGLTLIDWLFIGLILTVIGRSFGWQTLCVCAVFLGTNTIADIGWTSAALLRYDWIMLLIAGLCMLKQNRMTIAGGLIAYAVLLRIFPGLLLIAILLKEAILMYRSRSYLPSRPFLQFIAGGLIVCAIAIPAATLSSQRGIAVWMEFQDNLQNLINAPSSNFVGLQTVLSVRPVQPGRPVAPFLRIIMQILWNPKVVIPLIFAGYILLIKPVLASRPYWVAGVLGLGFIPILGDLSCYYYLFLIGFGLFYSICPRIGAELCLLALATTWLTLVTTWFKSFYWMSFFVLLFLSIVAWEVLQMNHASTGLKQGDS